MSEGDQSSSNGKKDKASKERYLLKQTIKDLLWVIEKNESNEDSNPKIIIGEDSSDSASDSD